MATTTALEKASTGAGVKALSEGQAKSALGVAVKKITSLEGKAEKLKALGQAAQANGVNTAWNLVYVAEVQAPVFLSAMADGYWPGRIKVAGIDPRPVLGGLLVAWGLADSLLSGGGGHQLALGNGLIAAKLASVGLDAGQRLRASKPGEPRMPGVVEGERRVQLTPPAHQGTHSGGGRRLTRARVLRGGHSDED